MILPYVSKLPFFSTHVKKKSESPLLCTWEAACVNVSVSLNRDSASVRALGRASVEDGRMDEFK